MSVPAGVPSYTIAYAIGGVGPSGRTARLNHPGVFAMQTCTLYRI